MQIFSYSWQVQFPSIARELLTLLCYSMFIFNQATSTLGMCVYTAGTIATVHSTYYKVKSVCVHIF